MTKPATDKEVAEILGVHPHTVERYAQNKRILMKYGLALINSDESLKHVLIKLKTLKKRTLTEE